MKLLWKDSPDQLAWRQALKVMDIVDAEDWQKNWGIAQVMSLNYDPTLILIAFNGKSLRQMEWYNR